LQASRLAHQRDGTLADVIGNALDCCEQRDQSLDRSGVVVERRRVAVRLNGLLKPTNDGLGECLVVGVVVVLVKARHDVGGAEPDQRSIHGRHRSEFFQGG